MQEEVIAEAPAEEVIPESAAQPTETTAESEQETKPESKEKTFTQEELDSIVQKRLAKESRRIAKLAEVEAENRMLKQQMEQARPRQEEPSGKPVPSQFQDYESYIEAVAEWKADQKLATIRAESEAQQRQREAQERASKVQQNSAAQRRNMRISRKLPLILPFRLLSTWRKPLQIRTWVVMWRITSAPIATKRTVSQAFPRPTSAGTHEARNEAFGYAGSKTNAPKPISR